MNQKAPPKIPKWLLAVQVWLLRRNIIRSFNETLMVITTTGRKSGKRFSLPIGYIRDGSDILTFSSIRGGRYSNWYENVLANKTATLEVQGQSYEMQGEPITDQEGLRHTLTVYKQNKPKMFERFFGVSPDAPFEEQAETSKKYVRFMRFIPVK